MSHVDEILFHVPGAGRTAFGAESAVQANVLVLDHHASGLEAFGHVEILGEVAGRGLRSRGRVGFLAVLRESDAVHRADVDTSVAFDAGRAGEHGLYVAIEAAMRLLERELRVEAEL